MSEFEDTINDNEVECPYCHYKYQQESEDYDEDERAEDCGECGKQFHLHESFSVSHHTRADCELNGEEHDYQSWEYGNGETHPFCVICDKCMPVKELEQTSKPNTVEG